MFEIIHELSFTTRLDLFQFFIPLAWNFNFTCTLQKLRIEIFSRLVSSGSKTPVRRCAHSHPDFYESKISLEAAARQTFSSFVVSNVVVEGLKVTCGCGAEKFSHFHPKLHVSLSLRISLSEKLLRVICLKFLPSYFTTGEGNFHVFYFALHSCITSGSTVLGGIQSKFAF